jgi:hypothetical protein
VRLIFGFGIVALSWLLCAGLSALVGWDLYWPMAAAWAWWAAMDARAHGLQRFERVFPLEPRALLFTVLLVWPLALPWYLRLKNQAMLGQLREVSRPSRAKYALVAAMIVLTVGGYGVVRTLSRSNLFRGVMAVAEAVQSQTRDAVNVTLNANGGLTVTIYNSAIGVADLAAREREARRLATVAANAIPPEQRVEHITVRFASRTARMGVTWTAPEQHFDWSIEELRTPPAKA